MTDRLWDVGEVADRLWDVGKVAGYLGVSEWTVRRRAAELGGMSVANRLRFRRADVDAWLDRQRLGPRNGRKGVVDRERLKAV